MSFGSDMIYYPNLQAFVDWQMFDNNKNCKSVWRTLLLFQKWKIVGMAATDIMETQGEMDYDN
jgi:hypothetical protein